MPEQVAGGALVAYLLGAIPFGLLLARYVAGVDVRDAGSGNIGATNVARTAGRVLGAVTLLLDAVKGALPVLAAGWLGQTSEVAAVWGLASVLGHIFPVYLRFRGGKGVATGLGMFLALTPLPTLLAASVFGATYAIARVVSSGSLLASITLVSAVYVIDARKEVLFVAAIVVLLVIVRHRGNIQRLLTRNEPKT